MCESCNLRFDTPSKKNKHELTHQKARAVKIHQHQQDDTTINSNQENVDSEVIPPNELIIENDAIVDNIPVEVHHSTIQVPETLTEPIKSKKVTLYQCMICKAYLSCASRLRQHLEKQHTCGDYTCKKCKKKIVTKSEFENHKRSCAEEIFKCEICGRSFLHKHSLTRHIKEIHEKISRKRIRICDICGHETSLNRIEAHVKTHIIAKPCEFCGEELSQQKALSHFLKRHQTSHKQVFQIRTFWSLDLIKTGSDGLKALIL